MDIKTILDPLREMSSPRTNLNDAFWKWFGKSKVVDDLGNPLVCYHGTERPGFDSFSQKGDSQLGYHFGSLSQAEYFTFIEEDPKEGAGLYPVYLRIEKPLTLRDWGYWNGNSVIPQLLDLGLRGIPTEVVELLDNNMDGKLLNRFTQEQIVSWIQASGYDGVRYYNRREGKSFESHEETYFDMDNVEDSQLQQVHGDNWAYIIFHPNQAKSIHNKGTWNPQSNKLNERAYHGTTIQTILNPLHERGYHGTDSDQPFDKWDRNAMGNNGQEFGWGIYITVSQEAGEHYASYTKGDNGIILEVEVDEKPGMRWLEWDSRPRPLLKKTYFEITGKRITPNYLYDGYCLILTEGDVYQAIAYYIKETNEWTDEEQATSNVLLKHGFQGAHFGEHSYVVFDPDAVRIVGNYKYKDKHPWWDGLMSKEDMEEKE